MADTVIEAVRRSNKDEEDKLSPECWVIGDHEFVKKILRDEGKRRMRAARFRIEGRYCEKDFHGSGRVSTGNTATKPGNTCV
jgi:hypothetical protein